MSFFRQSTIRRIYYLQKSNERNVTGSSFMGKNEKKYPKSNALESKQYLANFSDM
jgi:hypothetical protein